MSNAAVSAALRRMGYDTKTEMTGHGFRAMARTILHEELRFAVCCYRCAAVALANDSCIRCDSFCASARS